MPGPSRPRVLVVEDVSALGDVIRDALAQAEFVVDTAATSAEALDRLAARPYAAIVADCILPDQPVLAWLAALRGATRTTPLILCSGTISRADRLRRGVRGSRRPPETIQRGAARVYRASSCENGMTDPSHR
jgi:DNA-binding response OmpR family regulator